MNNSRETFSRRLLSGATTVYCGDHAYFGPNSMGRGAPTAGCKKCWLTWFLRSLATTPVEQIPEKVEHLKETIHKMIELQSLGRWDFEPYAHPEVHIEAGE